MRFTALTFVIVAALSGLASAQYELTRQYNSTTYRHTPPILSHHPYSLRTRLRIRQVRWPRSRLRVRLPAQRHRLVRRFYLPGGHRAEPGAAVCAQPVWRAVRRQERQ